MISGHQQDQQYSTVLGFSRRAAEFAACRRKRAIARFLLHLYLIQGFSGSFLILPDSLHAHCAVF